MASKNKDTNNGFLYLLYFFTKKFKKIYYLGSKYKIKIYKY